MHPRNLVRLLTSLRPARQLLGTLGALLVTGVASTPALAGVGPDQPVERQGPGAMTVLGVAIAAIVVLIMLGGLLNIRGGRGQGGADNTNTATNDNAEGDTKDNAGGNTEDNTGGKAS